MDKFFTALDKPITASIYQKQLFSNIGKTGGVMAGESVQTPLKLLPMQRTKIRSQSVNT
jgi:hypothetical protein